MLVIVSVRTWWPMHEHAVARTPLGRFPRAEMALLGMQRGSTIAATLAVGMYVVRVALSVVRIVDIVVMVLTGPL